MISQYPWLRSTWELLTNAEKSNRLGQAYLFKAQEKLGAERLIEKLAKGLICVKSGIEPCGKCRNCILTSTTNFPDLIRIGLADKKDSISVESVRELISFFSTKPAFGTPKIAIIDSVESLNFYATNALLKIIEEPPKNSIFLLNWETPRPVPRTLTSRCQQIIIPSPSRETSLKWLAGKGVEINKLNNEDAFLEGSPLEILSQIHNNDPNSSVLKNVANDVIALSQGQRNIIKVSEKYLSINPIILLKSLEILCHTISNIKYSHLPRKLLLSKRQNLDLQRLANNLNLTEILEFNRYLLDIKSKCLKSDGVKTSDFVETLFFKWSLLSEKLNEK